MSYDQRPEIITSGAGAQSGDVMMIDQHSVADLSKQVRLPVSEHQDDDSDGLKGVSNARKAKKPRVGASPNAHRGRHADGRDHESEIGGVESAALAVVSLGPNSATSPGTKREQPSSPSSPKSKSSQSKSSPVIGAINQSRAENGSLGGKGNTLQMSQPHSPTGAASHLPLSFSTVPNDAPVLKEDANSQSLLPNSQMIFFEGAPLSSHAMPQSGAAHAHPPAQSYTYPVPSEQLLRQYASLIEAQSASSDQPLTIRSFVEYLPLFANLIGNELQKNGTFGLLQHTLSDIQDTIPDICEEEWKKGITDPKGAELDSLTTKILGPNFPIGSIAFLQSRAKVLNWFHNKRTSYNKNCGPGKERRGTPGRPRRRQPSLNSPQTGNYLASAARGASAANSGTSSTPGTDDTGES